MDLKRYPKYIKYLKCSIFCKFAGFGLQLYDQRVPSQVFRRDKGYKLHSFLRVCRATTFQKNFTWLLVYVSLHKKKTASQQTIACSRSIETLEKLQNVYKVYNKDTGWSSIDVVLVSLLLTLNIFHTLF